MNLTLVLTIACSLLGSSPISIRSSTTVRGDYVEARTASVFAGPCHFNGEVMTTGGDAILAWHVTSGTWGGVDLAGVRAMAAVSCESNLADATAGRRSEIVIDSSASKAQSAAMVSMLRFRMGEELGEIGSVRAGRIAFVHYGRQYRVSAGGFGAMDVQGMPNDECCKQPNLVWYSPLMHLDWRKVGYTTTAEYSAGTLTDPWERADENDAFYGTFSIAR